MRKKMKAKTYERSTRSQQYIVFAGGVEEYADVLTFMFTLTAEQAEFIRQFMRLSYAHLTSFFDNPPANANVGTVSLSWPFVHGRVMDQTTVTAYLEVRPFGGSGDKGYADNLRFDAELDGPVAVFATDFSILDFEYDTVVDVNTAMLHTDGRHVWLSSFVSFGQGDMKLVSSVPFETTVMEILGCPVFEPKQSMFLYGDNPEDVLRQIAWITWDMSVKDKTQNKVKHIKGNYRGAWRHVLRHEDSGRVFLWYPGMAVPDFQDRVKLWGDEFPASFVIRMEVAAAIRASVAKAEELKRLGSWQTKSTVLESWSAIVRLMLHNRQQFPDFRHDFQAIMGQFAEWVEAQFPSLPCMEFSFMPRYNDTWFSDQPEQGIVRVYVPKEWMEDDMLTYEQGFEEWSGIALAHLIGMDMERIYTPTVKAQGGKSQ